MSQILHGRHIRPLDLVRCRLTHTWRRAPVILTGQKVDRTLLNIDLVHTVTSIKAAEVEVQIAMEDAIGLAGVHVPDELLVDVGRLGGLGSVSTALLVDTQGRIEGASYHHTPDPIRIEQSLVYDWRLVVELSFHREVVTSLQRNGATTADLICSNRTRHRHLACH